MGPIKRTCARPAASGDAEVLDIEAAKGQFPDLDVQDYPEAENVRVYRGSFAAETIDWSAEPGENLVIVVDGVLWSDGILDLGADQDDESALMLHVRGTVSVRDVAVHGDAQLQVDKDLEAERVVMCGGGNLGNITVVGKLRAAIVLEWTDGQIHAGSGDTAAWARQPHNVQIPDARWVAPAEAVAPHFLDKTGEPDRLELAAGINQGESPFG
jgi:hypothetical protein